MCEIPAYFLSGFVYEKLGIKMTLIGFYGFSIFGSITYMAVITENNILIAVMILLTKFGVSGTFNIAYLANASLFPAIFRSTTFGICNIFARVITILAPLIAETDDPFPMMTFTIMAGVGIAASLFFVTKPPKPK